LGVPGDSTGGVSDTAVTFNGTSQYVSLSSAAGEAFGADLNTSSYEFVLKTTNTIVAEMICAGANSGSTTSFQVLLNSTIHSTVQGDMIRLFVRDNSNNNIQATFSATNLFNGSYHHLVLTYNAGTVNAYVDGVAQTVTNQVTGSTPAVFSAFVYPIDFAAYSEKTQNTATAEFAAVTLDEGALYATALTPTQVTGDYQALNGIIFWTGFANNNWDTTTANWTNSVPMTAFANGEAAGFGDTASSFSVNVAANLTPGSVTFSNSLNNYTISSSGGFSIGGAGALTNLGAGTVTLLNANTYSGNTIIANGTLALGVGGSIANSSVSLAGGATFDVSAISTAAAPYNMGGTSFAASGDAPAILKIASAGFVTNPLPTTLTLTSVAGAVPLPALTVAQGTLVLSNNQFTINGPLLPAGIYTVVNTSGTGAIAYNAKAGDTFPTPTGTAIGWPGTTASIAVSGSGSSAVLALTISNPNACVGGLVATNGTWTRAYSLVDANDEQLSFGNTNGIYSVVGFNMVNCTNSSGTASVYGGGTVAVGPGTPYLIGFNGSGSTSGTATVLPVGTTNLVLIMTQATQGEGQTARVNALVVADGCSANTMSFDPISASLYLSRSGEVRIVFNNVSQNDKYVNLQNGAPGLRYARLIVNGTVFALNGLADGASLSVDISSALTGGTGNTVVVEGFGAKGAGAVVSIGETPAAPASGNFQVTAASAVSTFINLPALQITQSGDQTVLSWPATGPAGEDFTAYQLQTSASGLPGSWSAAGTAPVSAGGQLTVTVTAGGSGQFYQLANPAAQ
jgi:autotransporter-associated beta strand protein